VRAYIRQDPRWVEEKLAEGYSLAQIGALAMLMGQAEQQPERGRFKSMALLVASMDCKVEEHGPRARTSQHLQFLMDRGDVAKVEGGSGYYVDGWDELQEGDQSPQARMEIVRGRKGRPGDPSSSGARRNREWRARKAPANGSDTAPAARDESVTKAVTNESSDASQGEPPCDVTSEAGSDASPVSRARAKNVSRKQEQKAEAVAVVTRHNPNGADGLSTEPTDATVYGQRFMDHGRTPSGEDIDFLDHIAVEYDRLARPVVLEAIDDVAAKHLAKGLPMPRAKYLAGRLGDLQAAASDAGVRPRAMARPQTGMTRLGAMLPRLAQA